MGDLKKQTNKQTGISKADIYSEPPAHTSHQTHISFIIKTKCNGEACILVLLEHIDENTL